MMTGTRTRYHSILIVYHHCYYHYQQQQKTIVFNATKKESHNPTNGFKKLFRRLRSNYKVTTNKDEVSRDRLADANVIVFGGSREPFTTTEFDEIKAWINSGGRALVMLQDGGEKVTGCNFNTFLEDFGLGVKNDSVMRSVYFKYTYPKEVFISDGVLVSDLARKKNAVNLGGARKQQTQQITRAEQQAIADKLNFVYPYGATLTIEQKSRARPILSSGSISYPMNRPIAAVWEAETVSDVGGQRGRLVVIGSVEFFGDDWLDKEENNKICDVLFSWLLNETELDLVSDSKSQNLNEYMPIPHIEALSMNVKSCLQGMDELPRDFQKMFDMKMFQFDTDLIPQTIQLYDVLSVPHDSLTLIPPQFECPLPKLSPATFPPAMREPAPPALDQFDLDEHFAKEGLRLAQLTNKCTNGDDDLEYYIAESGEIVGIMQDLPFGERSAKHILFQIFKRIVNYKKQDGGDAKDVVSSEPVIAYEYNGDESIEAAPVTAHIAHVDLAPMRGDAGRSLLTALDPNLQIGGPAIGESKSSKGDYDKQQQHHQQAKGGPYEDKKSVDTMSF